MKTRWVVVVLGGLVAGINGCHVGEAQEECATYGCLNSVSLSGSVTAEQPLKTLDATYCLGADCKTETVDVAAGSINGCEVGITDRIVCVGQTDGKLELRAVWQSAGDAPPLGSVKASIKLVDPETGAILVDQQRTGNVEITREDNCHRCWSSELTL